MVAGSNQRPSEVLASLLEFCPLGEEGTAFFRAAFTMRLPVAIQAHLAGTELTDLKELAQMANCLWLCHGPQPVAAIPVEEYKSEVSKGKGLCWKHQRYGKDTLNCVDKKNCTWSGN